jgi:hypothetical protein
MNYGRKQRTGSVQTYARIAGVVVLISSSAVASVSSTRRRS